MEIGYVEWAKGYERRERFKVGKEERDRRGTEGSEHTGGRERGR